MGNPVRLEGDLDIVPPLSWSDLKKNPGYRPQCRDDQMRIDYDEHTTDTEQGELISRIGVGVGYASRVTYGLEHSRIHRDLEDILKALPKGTELQGYFECWDEEGDHWRIAVQEGEIVDIHPKLVWPDWMDA